MRGDQLSRQWRILRHIQAHRKGVSVNELVTLENVTRRTIYRDLQTLQEAGFPLYTERIGNVNHWGFVNDYSLKLHGPFTLSELIALYIYCDFAKMYRGSFFHDPLESLFEKLKDALPKATVEFLDQVRQAFSAGIKPYKDYRLFAEMINHIAQAINERRQIKFRYHVLYSDEVMERLVDPLKIWLFGGTLYLIGHCHLRKALRTFVIDRIQHLHVTDNIFSKPDDSETETYLRQSFKVMQDQLYSVKIYVSPQWARWVGEHIWHESQKIKKLPDGGLELTFHVSGLDEIRQWVLSLGPQVRVVEPPELIQQVMESASGILALYGNS